MVSFSKGTFQCVGIYLACAELYLAIARIFRAYGSAEMKSEDDEGYLELFETTEENDVRLARDVFVPTVKAGSNGVRVLVKK